MAQKVDTVSGDGRTSARTGPFRRELLAHCYRMTGSLDEAEDLVQETLLRAWRAYDRFEGRSSVRTWLYRIATNVCLTALVKPGRRVLPAGLGQAAGDPNTAMGSPPSGVAWLQPVPDAVVAPEAGDPASVAEFRESIRLALVASLQYLPPRQRAVILFREVLGWSAAEVADALETSVAAVEEHPPAGPGPSRGNRTCSRPSGQTRRSPTGGTTRPVHGRLRRRTPTRRGWRHCY